MNKILSLLAIVLATAATSFAGQDVTTSKKVVVAPCDDCVFHANEWQIDAFFAGAAGKFNGQNANGVGGGLGVNYFFTKYFGVGVDDTLGSINRKAYDSVQGDLILRYPICSWHLAPYAFIGGGATWGNNVTAGDGNAGIGLEYRIVRNIGVFVDSRWLYGSRNLSESLSRGGIRVAF